MQTGFFNPATVPLPASVAAALKDINKDGMSGCPSPVVFTDQQPEPEAQLVLAFDICPDETGKQEIVHLRNANGTLTAVKVANPDVLYRQMPSSDVVI